MLDALLLALVLMFIALIALTLAMPRLHRAPIPGPVNAADIAIGVVRRVADDGDRSVLIDVDTGSGQSFTGRLRYHRGDPVASRLQPGTPVLVAFDPAAREHLSLPDEMAVVRAAFDQMLVGKGLLTVQQLELTRTGSRCRAVITAARPTGRAREDYREVELDLMVSRPLGGQFAAHEVTLVPVSALGELCPGATVDVYYRRGDETAVAVCVPPR